VRAVGVPIACAWAPALRGARAVRRSPLHVRGLIDETHPIRPVVIARRSAQRLGECPPESRTGPDRLVSHGRGIEPRLVVGPRVQGIPIEEQGTINDVILPPGQTMEIRKVEGVANGRLVVDAVLLPHDFDGALTEADRQGLELAQAIVGDETRKALQVADSHPGLLADPNLLHGHSSQTLALRRAMETSTRDSADLVAGQAGTVPDALPTSSR
jgi:hypothetical protein